MHPALSIVRFTRIDPPNDIIYDAWATATHLTMMSWSAMYLFYRLMGMPPLVQPDEPPVLRRVK